MLLMRKDGVIMWADINAKKRCTNLPKKDKH